MKTKILLIFIIIILITAAFTVFFFWPKKEQGPMLPGGIISSPSIQSADNSEI